MSSIKKYGPWPSYSDEEIKIASKILLSGKVNYWTGIHGKEFEKEFAEYTGTNYAIALSNGTIALELALKAIELEPKDEVIVTPRSFIASASCVVNEGGIPIFSDIEKNSGNLSIESIKENITKNTKAIICVHLGGWPCEMDEIMELAEQNNIYVIEDCAQAHGSKYKKQSVGSIGHIGAWSFCQDKIMTTAGEGGMITTNDKELWKKMWSLKDHGKDKEQIDNLNNSSGFKWLHNSVGSNYRMTEIQSAIGRHQLKKLDSWKSERVKNAMSIVRMLRNFDKIIDAPICPNHMDNGFYRLYAYVKIKNLSSGWSRDRIVQEVNSSGVPCFQGSCPEIYLENAFKNTKYFPKERLPNAKDLGEKSLAFLVHPTLTEENIDHINESISSILQRASG